MVLAIAYRCPKRHIDDCSCCKMCSCYTWNIYADWIQNIIGTCRCSSSDSDFWGCKPVRCVCNCMRMPQTGFCSAFSVLFVKMSSLIQSEALMHGMQKRHYHNCSRTFAKYMRLYRIQPAFSQICWCLMILFAVLWQFLRSCHKSVSLRSNALLLHFIVV